MIAAIIAGAFLIGFLFGWAMLPVLVAVGAIVVIARRGHRAIAVLAIVAAMLGVLRSQDMRGHELDASWLPTDAITGEIAGAVIDDGRTQSFTLHSDGNHRLCVRAFSRANLRRGDRISAGVRADELRSISPGYAAYLRARRCDWSATLNGVTV